MKNILKSGFIALLTVFAMTSCNPQENDDHSLGAMGTITLEEITYTQTTSEKSDNEIIFTNTTKTNVPYSFVWDLDNGVTSKDKTVTAQYPEKGDYNVTLTVYTADGNAVSKIIPLHFDNNDFSLLDKPAYNKLTGGPSDADGKTWVFDQYNNFTKEVAAAVEKYEPSIKDIKGHIGLGPANSYGQNWWGANPNDKEKWSMYDMKFTFIQSGLKMDIESAGKGYGRWASASGKPGATKDGDDAIFDYAGGSYNFSIDESGNFPKLTLTGDAFMGYYCGTQTYEIFYQTDEVMALRAYNEVENQDWVYIFCREDLNVGEPPIVKTPKVVPLNEDFEGESFINFVAQDMGKKSGVVDNPAPVPVNESDKVYRYQKSDAFYSNLSFTTKDYLFDLTTQNKIRLKVYIPSYNDYTKDNAVDGDWVTNKKLLPQIAVKLQNSTLGDNAYKTQTEVVKLDLETDKWLELEFDFSGVSDHQDYDKIVLQFGAEGHAGPGIFFFDDFSFAE